MKIPTYQEMLDAGVHFGHLRKKWNPKMRQYIFAEHKGIHIIDVNRTSENLEKAANALKNIVKSGRKVMFVATKKQAREILATAAQNVNMPYVTERWLGGMMTNFATIRRSVKKMHNIERMLAAGNEVVSITKKERLTLDRERAKLDKELGGISQLNRLPDALYIVDIGHEHIALQEATRLGIKTFAMVDTNCDPNLVDFAIPANDDASKSITLITSVLVEAIKEGLEERKQMKVELEGVTAAANS
ncbi:MAG: 30S ribosomal protein S2 [Saprospiraceae bacterium]|jgi:small subunit ribosomal protein S2|nr:30S ribosomal protein S2 [Saprospiraceae bacterium]MBK6480763.1 30S ribosomal protein S2 [Saprospiraceae bacterium]MBK6816879.1 30S ribosomal protein S2 [Saprospiraceae bacterium]MBK7371407.1 30S ribosomal protein S2 [Saprospiraceae bacterium]MBK7436098.1 30S ribosomal protein S2 [Saprospiraceae bacterium]